MPCSAFSARSAASVTTSGNRSTNSTSTMIQVGCSRDDFGSWNSLRGSNWVGSGTPVRDTRAMPATPVGSALEW